MASDFVVSVTLANGIGGKPVPLVASLFQLRLASGLLKTPKIEMPATDPWVDGTSPAIGDSLSDAASFGPWILRFATDAYADAPVSLTFSPPGLTEGDATVGDVRKATAPVVLERCTACGPVCTYLDRDPDNCGACGKVGEHVTCRQGRFTCSEGTACAGREGRTTCVDTKTSYDNCGGCGVRVPDGGSCENGALKCSATRPTRCGDRCVDTDTDDANCGSCGHACTKRPGCDEQVETYVPGGFAHFGTKGKCGDPYDQQTKPPYATCDQICAHLGETCASPDDPLWAGSYAYCDGSHWKGGCGTPIPAEFMNCGFGRRAESKCNCIVP